MKRLPASALFVVRGELYSFTPLGGTQAISLSVWLRLANPAAEAWTVAGAVGVPGTRVVTLGNIRFPDGPQPEH